MAEVLTYSQSLTSLTGGRGDYHMSFLRYEEVPSHIAQKLIEDAKKARESEKGLVVPGGAHRRSTAPSAGARCSWARTRRASRPTASSTSTSARSAAERAMEAGWYREGDAEPARPGSAPRERASSPSLFGAPQAPPRFGCAADPQPAVPGRAGDRRGRGALQRQLPPADDRGLMRSLGAPRAAVRPGGDRGHRHRGRLGDLLVPVPREPGRVRPRADDRARLRRSGARHRRHDWNADVDSAGRLVPRVAPE